MCSTVERMVVSEEPKVSSANVNLSAKPGPPVLAVVKSSTKYSEGQPVKNGSTDSNTSHKVINITTDTGQVQRYNIFR